MSDDGFHEIQLSKKQLVFLFMAAAVSLVVAFLIGVWLGRDVRRPETEVADAPVADVTPDVQQPPTQVSPKDLDYNARVASGAPKTEPKPEETTKPVEPPTPAAESGPPEPAPKTEAAKAPPAAKTEAPAGAFHLQVGAFGTRKPADTLAARLSKKGYTAYVVTVTTGAARFRVHVGPYADRPSAQAAADRLKKEERLSPLVQR